MSDMIFLVFEGLDGSGKTSLIQHTSSFLTLRNIPCIVTREPGGTPLGEELRKIILRREGDTPSPRSELLLYEAIRAHHVDRVITPALAKKQWVICDRFTASSVAFQTGGRGIQTESVHWLNDFATGGLQPHLNVLLDLSHEKSLERQQKRFAATGETADRFESEQSEFHQRVRQSYLAQARQNPTNWLVLDASQTTENMFKQLTKRLAEKKWLES
jgi:dTMP kinase